MKKNSGNDVFKRRIRGVTIIILRCLVFIVWLPLATLGAPGSELNYNLSAPEDLTVKGTVTDVKGLPLPGVSIRIGTTAVGTATGMDGTFSLRCPQGTGTLTFSFVGYKTVSLPFTAGKALNVTMTEDVHSLEEVQVVAYGTQRKRDMVGAMSVVKADEMKDLPSAGIGNLLQGRVAGMDVTNVTGAPGGGGTSITIRGFNSLSIESSRRGSDPLWVIDGVPMYSFTSPVSGLNTLSEIDPKDIETVQVLKDASSASIYGSRAANGVILVTTKKGQLNGRARVSVNVAQSFVFNASHPDMTGGVAERRLRNEALDNYQQTYFDREKNEYVYPADREDSYVNGAHNGYYWNKGDGASIPIYQDSLNPYFNNSTNLFDYYLRTARVTDASLQVSGGAERMTYNVGIGYYDETGVLRHTGFNRIKLMSNFMFRPMNRVEINLRNYVARTGRNRSAQGRDVFSTSGGTDLEQIPGELLTTSTLLPGPGTAAFEELTRRFNETKEKNESWRFRNSFDLSIEVVTGLRLKSSVAMDYSMQFQNVFMPSELDAYKESYSSNSTVRNLMLLNENLLTYTRSFGDHNVDALLGLSFQKDEMNSGSMYGKKSASDLIHYITWSGQVMDEATKRLLKDCFSDLEESTMVGVFGRVNYNYKQKYLASVTLRRDASSKFGEDVRWATFPSYAVGYVLSEEKFMDWSRGVLDYAKIRASFGTSGKQFEAPYLAFGTLQTGKPFLGNPTISPEWYEGLMNRSLTWEETKQWDLGLDMDFFDHRLGFVLDYYHRYTDKLLYKVKLPGDYSGYLYQWQNAYAISNQGIELQVKGDLIRSERLNWNVTVNLAKNWNRLEKSTNNRDVQRFDNGGTMMNNVSVIGRPLNGLYVYQDRGFYNDASQVPFYYDNGKKVYYGTNNQFYRPGDRVLSDVDGNGTIGTNYPLYDDRVYAGSPLPTIQGGVASSLTWGDFDVNLLLSYSLGRHILNAGRSASIGTRLGLTTEDITRPVFADLDNVTFWQKPGDDADYPMNRLEVGLMNYATNLLSNVEKVNYIKLKSLTIGYSLPESIRQRIGVGARIFVSGENLFTLTNYSGTDPEAVDLVTGVDNLGNYPLARRVTVGLTLSF